MNAKKWALVIALLCLFALHVTAGSPIKSKHTDDSLKDVADSLSMVGASLASLEDHNKKPIVNGHGVIAKGEHKRNHPLDVDVDEYKLDNTGLHKRDHFHNGRMSSPSRRGTKKKFSIPQETKAKLNSQLINSGLLTAIEKKFGTGAVQRKPDFIVDLDDDVEDDVPEVINSLKKSKAVSSNDAYADDNKRRLDDLVQNLRLLSFGPDNYLNSPVQDRAIDKWRNSRQSGQGDVNNKENEVKEETVNSLRGNHHKGDVDYDANDAAYLDKLQEAVAPASKSDKDKAADKTGALSRRQADNNNYMYDFDYDDKENAASRGTSHLENSESTNKIDNDQVETIEKLHESIDSPVDASYKHYEIGTSFNTGDVDMGHDTAKRNSRDTSQTEEVDNEDVDSSESEEPGSSRDKRLTEGDKAAGSKQLRDVIDGFDPNESIENKNSRDIAYLKDILGLDDDYDLVNFLERQKRGLEEELAEMGYNVDKQKLVKEEDGSSASANDQSIVRAEKDERLEQIGDTAKDNKVQEDKSDNDLESELEDDDADTNADSEVDDQNDDDANDESDQTADTSEDRKLAQRAVAETETQDQNVENAQNTEVVAEQGSDWNMEQRGEVQMRSVDEAEGHDVDMAETKDSKLEEQNVDLSQNSDIQKQNVDLSQDSEIQKQNVDMSETQDGKLQEQNVDLSQNSEIQEQNVDTSANREIQESSADMSQNREVQERSVDNALKDAKLLQQDVEKTQEMQDNELQNAAVEEDVDADKSNSYIDKEIAEQRDVRRIPDDENVVQHGDANQEEDFDDSDDDLTDDDDYDDDDDDDVTSDRESRDISEDEYLYEEEDEYLDDDDDDDDDDDELNSEREVRDLDEDDEYFDEDTDYETEYEDLDDDSDITDAASDVANVASDSDIAKVSSDSDIAKVASDVANAASDIVNIVSGEANVASDNDAANVASDSYAASDSDASNVLNDAAHDVAKAVSNGKAASDGADDMTAQRWVRNIDKDEDLDEGFNEDSELEDDEDLDDDKDEISDVAREVVSKLTSGRNERVVPSENEMIDDVSGYADLAPGGEADMYDDSFYIDERVKPRRFARNIPEGEEEDANDYLESDVKAESDGDTDVDDNDEDLVDEVDGETDTDLESEKYLGDDAEEDLDDEDAEDDDNDVDEEDDDELTSERDVRDLSEDEDINDDEDDVEEQDLDNVDDLESELMSAADISAAKNLDDTADMVAASLFERNIKAREDLNLNEENDDIENESPNKSDREIEEDDADEEQDETDDETNSDRNTRDVDDDEDDDNDDENDSDDDEQDDDDDDEEDDTNEGSELKPDKDAVPFSEEEEIVPGMDGNPEVTTAHPFVDLTLDESLDFKIKETGPKPEFEMLTKPKQPLNPNHIKKTNTVTAAPQH